LAEKYQFYIFKTTGNDTPLRNGMLAIIKGPELKTIDVPQGQKESTHQ